MTEVITRYIRLVKKSNAMFVEKDGQFIVTPIRDRDKVFEEIRISREYHNRINKHSSMPTRNPKPATTHLPKVQ